MRWERDDCRASTRLVLPPSLVEDAPVLDRVEGESLRDPSASPMSPAAPPLTRSATPAHGMDRRRGEGREGDDEALVVGKLV